MTAHLLWLQLPFLYLPLLLASLAIYGADFEHPSGVVYQWTPVVVAVLHVVTRRFGRVLDDARVRGPLLVACAVVVAIAYRPLHMHWWDERSTTQAVRVLAVGVASVLASNLGAWRVARAGGPRTAPAARAFVVLAVALLGTLLYPLLPLLALAPIFAAGATLPDEVTVTASQPRRHVAPFGGVHRYVVTLLALELSLPLWDLQTNPRWGLFAAAGLFGAALGLWWARRAPVTSVVLPIVAAFFALWSALDSDQVVALSRALVIGGAAGWILLPVLDARSTAERPASLSWVTPLWALGMLLGFVLSANRAFLGWRMLLWIPLVVVFALRVRRPSRA